jgi:Ca2+:H+ antiporter
LHNPPGEANALRIRPDAPEALKHQERKFFEGEPEVNQYVCIVVLLLSIAIMAATVEWVGQSIVSAIHTHSHNSVACREH